MIRVNKDGIYYTEKNNTVKIDEDEILSFLREPIFEVEHNFKVKDFVNLFKSYELLNLIVPEFQEVVLEYNKKQHIKEVEFEKISMSIGGSISCTNQEQYAKMFIQVQSVCHISPELVCCFPANETSFSSLINSEIIISPKFSLLLDLESKEIRSLLPFSISQFTLFDFISAISMTLVSSVFKEQTGISDEFTLQKNEMIKMKKQFEEEIRNSQNNEASVEEETNKVLDTINNLINKNKEDK